MVHHMILDPAMPASSKPSLAMKEPPVDDILSKCPEQHSADNKDRGWRYSTCGNADHYEGDRGGTVDDDCRCCCSVAAHGSSVIG